MSIQILPRPPAQPTALRTRDCWDVMEARLITAQVQDLVGRAVERLARLDGSDELPHQVDTLVDEALRLLDTAQGKVEEARRSLSGS